MQRRLIGRGANLGLCLGMGLQLWSLKMAFRDARASWRRLALFALSIQLGVAGLVAVTGFRDSLEQALAGQAKAVLGADLELSGRAAFGSEEEALFREIGGEQAREVNLTTLVFFPRTSDSRLVQLRALEGGFPFYGEIETEPSAAGRDWAAGTAPGVLVERTLLLQFGLEVGDVARVGTLELPIAGALVASPGEAAGFGTVAPRVYLPLSQLEATGLLKSGSFARYKQYFRLEGVEDVEGWLAPRRDAVRALRLRVETVRERQQELGEALDQVTGFLSLAGFVALLLGAVGVASALHLHVRPKLAMLATLRCLGAPAGAASRVFLWQGLTLGILGSAVGALTGLAVQGILPSLLAAALPFEVPRGFSWGAVGQGFATGCLTAFVFALWPLLGLGKISPLLALRAGFEDRLAKPGLRSRLVLGVVTALMLSLLAIQTSGSVTRGLLFMAVVILVVGLLTGAAKLAAALARKMGARVGPFWLRQGVANLHRPQNRTVLLTTALGLALFLALSLMLLRGSLLEEFSRSTSGDRPNLVLWDVQPDQLDAVEQKMREQGVPATAKAPVVTMRIAAIGGRTVDQLVADPGLRIPNWRLRREYRSTFRAETVGSETVREGSFTGTWSEASGGLPPISIERDMARELGLAVGDRVAWDVQGVPLETVVGSIREVEWRGFSPNFFVVFPVGVLEAAPSFWLVAGRASDPVVSARLQRAVGRDLPGVSILDLASVLETFDAITRKIGAVVQFMALFTALTAVIVLAGALLAGKGQRVREAVLLRTLGASRGMVVRIESVEYALLGSLASVVGGLFAWVAAWGLGASLFRISEPPPAFPLLWGWAGMVLLTTGLGWWTGRSVRQAPPLAVLRAE